MADAEWTCADCGTPGAHAVSDPQFGSFAAFDSRYTTGYCDRCTVAHPKVPRKGPRRTSRLVRSDVFDRAAFVAGREKAKLKELVQLFAGGKHNIQLTDQQVLDLVSLYDKHGAPGFYLQPWIRERYEGLHAKKA